VQEEREGVVDLSNIQLHNAQFLEFIERKKNRSTVPYGFIVRRPYQICLRSSEDTFDFIAFSIWIKALTETGRLK
jgi:hypothetical protein